MGGFSPSFGVDEAGADAVPADDFYPALTIAALRSETGMGSTFAPEEAGAILRAAARDIKRELSKWRATQAALSPAAAEDFSLACYFRARGDLIDVNRDYGTTKTGHDRADALDLTLSRWRRLSAEAIARIRGGDTAWTVELL